MFSESTQAIKHCPEITQGKKTMLHKDESHLIVFNFEVSGNLIKTNKKQK